MIAHLTPRRCFGHTARKEFESSERSGIRTRQHAVFLRPVILSMAGRVANTTGACPELAHRLRSAFNLPATSRVRVKASPRGFINLTQEYAMTRTRRPSVKLVHGQAITTSLKVAEFFGKHHWIVLRAIQNLESPKEFTDHNFVACEYTGDNGKTLPMYTITRDGFALLAMGFTGKEAMQWKIAYLEAFNKLEAAALEKLKARKTLPSRQRVLPTPAAPVALPSPEQSMEQLALSRLREQMFILHFGKQGDMYLFSRSRKCIVVEPELLADHIADPNSDIWRELLPAIIGAAAGRLAR